MFTEQWCAPALTLLFSVLTQVVSGVVSAPLWNSNQRQFAGMLTVSDIIHLIQYYYFTLSSYDVAAAEVEEFRLESLRGASTPKFQVMLLMNFGLSEIERKLHVPPPPLLSIHPMEPLYEACKMLIKTHARRLPLLDADTRTGDEAVISVLTQYRLLKFIAINVRFVPFPASKHVPYMPYYPIHTVQGGGRPSPTSTKTEHWHICHPYGKQPLPSHLLGDFVHNSV